MTTLKVKKSSAILKALEDLKNKTQANRKKSIKSKENKNKFVKRICG